MLKIPKQRLPKLLECVNTGTWVMANIWSNLLLLRRHSFPKNVIIDRHARRPKKRFPKSCAVCWVGAKWLGELRPRGKRVSQNKLNEICHPRFAFLLAYRLHRDTKSPMGVRHGKLNYNKKRQICRECELTFALNWRRNGGERGVWVTTMLANLASVCFVLCRHV